MTSHLLHLSRDWDLWKIAGLRSAGFPARRVLKLGFESLAEAADRWLLAEAELEEARTALAARLGAALDRLKAEGDWGDLARRRPLLAACTALRKGKWKRLAERAPEGVDLAPLGAARERLEHARDDFETTYAEAVEAQAAALHEIARDPRFREAMLWQNRAAVHTGLDKIALRPPAKAARDSQRRQHEELTASYFQRYTVKNDTIGFFGPIARALFTEGGPVAEARIGPRLIAHTGVFFEAWCIETLARPFVRQPAMKPWLRPRLVPVVFVPSPAALLRSAVRV